MTKERDLFRAIVLAAVGLVPAGCGSGMTTDAGRLTLDGGQDAGKPDAGNADDAGMDAAVADAGMPVDDAGSMPDDAGQDAFVAIL